MVLEHEIVIWLEQQSVNLLLHDARGRRTLLHQAGLENMLNALDFEGATLVFCREVTHYLWQYGMLSDGRDPLVALLETAKTSVGIDKQAECDALIDRLRGAERQTAPSRRIRGDVRRILLACAIVLALIAGYYVIASFPNGVAIQGDQNTVIGANTGTIHVSSGVQPELFAEYVKKLALTEETVQRFFDILEQEQVPRDEWDRKLQEIAAQYKELLQRLEVIQSEDPEVVTLKTQARHAIEDGKFDEAETLLNQTETRDVEAIEQLEAVANQRRLSAAETNADNARLQEIRLRYAKAADYWRKAADLLPENEQKTRSLYLSNAGYDFYRVARYADALPFFEQSLALYREIGDKAGVGEARTL